MVLAIGQSSSCSSMSKLTLLSSLFPHLLFLIPFLTGHMSRNQDTFLASVRHVCENVQILGHENYGVGHVLGQVSCPTRGIRDTGPIWKCPVT